jgi:hypothetical protein
MPILATRPTTGRASVARIRPLRGCRPSRRLPADQLAFDDRDDALGRGEQPPGRDLTAGPRPRTTAS